MLLIWEMSSWGSVGAATHLRCTSFPLDKNVTLNLSSFTDQMNIALKPFQMTSQTNP